MQALAVPWYPGPLVVANDLERPVMRHHPELLAIRRALLRGRAEVALMSGSGSAVFGLFPTVAARPGGGGRARRGIARRPGQASGGRWRVIVTRFLGGGAYQRSLAAAGSLMPATRAVARRRSDRAAGGACRLPALRPIV